MSSAYYSIHLLTDYSKNALNPVFCESNRRLAADLRRLITDLRRRIADLWSMGT